MESEDGVATGLRKRAAQIQDAHARREIWDGINQGCL